jgi:hypothetical protein
VEPVRLLGVHAVTLPDFADREDLARAWLESAQRGHRVVLRVYAAYLGLCTPLGRTSKADWSLSRCDALVYGGAVYSYMRDQGATPAQISAAALPLVGLIYEHLAPRETEVVKRADFSGPSAVQ